MINEALWRKTPTNLLTDETMQFIERQLPAEYAYAPYMFYQACLKKADADGIFDIDDGVIFASLMRVPSVQLVFRIAELMVRRKVIFQIKPGVNKCMLADWDYNKNDVKRTMEERRAIAQRQIEEAGRRNSVSSFSYNAPEDTEDAPKSSFSCSYDDKNGKNVDKSSFDDKKSENVDKTAFDDKNAKSVVSLDREKDREIDTQDKTRKKETHTHNKETETERQTDAGTSAGQNESPAAVPAKKKKALAEDKQPEAEEQKDNLSDSAPDTNTDTLASEEIQVSVGNEQDTGRNSVNNLVESVLVTFFKGVNLGFDESKGQTLITQIANDIVKLSSEKHSAEKIAGLICQEFQLMHESAGEWKDIPLYPVYMVKPSVWAYILTQVNKKLKAGKKSKFLQEAELYAQEAEQEQKAVVDEFNRAYVEHGIDPNDPLKVQKLMRAKSQEQQDVQEVVDKYGGVF